MANLVGNLGAEIRAGTVDRTHCFQSGAGEQNPAFGGQGRHGLSIIGFSILKVLGFVPNYAEEGNGFEEFEIANQSAIGGDD